MENNHGSVNSPQSASSRAFDRRAYIDIAIRLVLMMAFAALATVYIKHALAEFQAISQTDAGLQLLLSRGLSILAVSLYTLMIAILYAVRLRPINTFAGIAPSIAALFGGFLPFGLLLFEPRTALPLGVQVFSFLLILIGNVFAVYVLSYLGRSFSILPEGRKLVTSGPYRLIRHPLYFAEAIAIIGAMTLFLSWGAVILVLAQLAFQLMRMHYEEKVLRENFPEYADYARRVARIIPYVY